ncbi:hypothetical protein QR46_2480 [Giardia duodenalis assemblage B]|uniref:Uncharacterized protein n=2 Tax=Giardia intestinalis TaxID=5741 RepID=A0A132NTV3_GIAIN|nr:Hypothetical protein GL50581_3644 [Giardia intestinalis ATCC 50581]KWX13513.1 hypothetical protein QR46_2480 [Giardia intestinalis assemblage B]
MAADEPRHCRASIPAKLLMLMACGSIVSMEKKRDNISQVDVQK